MAEISVSVSIEEKVELIRLRGALRDIMEATARRSLPLTDQIYRRAAVALGEKYDD